MSASRNSARRVALLSSSSLGLAAIVSAASLGAFLAPTTASAQTATCAPPPTSGNGTNAVTYAGDNATTAGVTYNPGITCTYTGDGATVSTTGNITVSTSGGVPGDPLVNGVNLRATGTSDIRWDSTAGVVSGGAQTNGPVIEAITEAGDINITGLVVRRASGTTVTDAIRAASTGGGNINIETQVASSTSGALSRGGIAAVATGGSGNVNVTAGDFLADTGETHGRLYGVLVQASGSGAVTINASRIQAADAINVTMGTGLLTINAARAWSNAAGGAALRVNTQGSSEVNIRRAIGSTGTGEGNASITLFDFTTVAGTTTTLTIGDPLSENRIGENTLDTRLFRMAGGSDLTIRTLSIMGGHVDFSAHTGSMTWDIDRLWATKGDPNGVNRFAAGADTLRINEGAYWLLGHPTLTDTGPGDRTALETTSVMFSDGDDRIINNGAIMLGPKAGAGNAFGRNNSNDHLEAEITIAGLETFENAGDVYFGGNAPPLWVSPFAEEDDIAGDLRTGSYAVGPDYTETDNVADDVLLMPDTRWIASGDSRLVMDVLVGANQTACDVSLRNTAVVQQSQGIVNGIALPPIDVLTGEMPAADCMNLAGGSTEGVTKILLNQLGGGDRGGPTRIVLVDVAGGESNPGDFILDPMNHGFVDSPDGGYLDVGYFIYPLVYDAEAQQHILVGGAGPNAWQTATWATAAHDLWRTSTGSWFERQADLRGGIEPGVGGGVWLRTSADFVDRDVMQVQPIETSTFTWDNSYEQNTYAVTGGIDLMAGGGADRAFVVGVMAGYGNAQLDYGASINSAQLDSWNGGLYGSFLAGGLYVDALVSATKGDVEADMPGLNLFPAGTLLSTPFLSVGAQIEGGWRFPLAQDLFVEPLAGLSWVRTEWDSLHIASADPLRPGVDVDFGDPVSLRGNVGARLGMDRDYGGYRAQYSILGRVWNESEGEHELTLDNVADDVFVGDALTGTLSEFGVGISLYGLSDAVSGFLNFGGKFADDYSSQNASVGVRVNW